MDEEPGTGSAAVRRTIAVRVGRATHRCAGHRHDRLRVIPFAARAFRGIITPSALHFERHHSGVPDIPPGEHRLLIHGLVDRPLTFDLASLSRYPLVSRIHFIECSGNSAGLFAADPPQGGAGALHGLLSCSDWTGVPLSTLLDEVGVRPAGKWLLAEGADAAAMSRSVPIDKAWDDALIAIYQNGERLRPENGFPMRLLLPGWEGNASVKWLRRLKVTAGPVMTKDETSKYTGPHAGRTGAAVHVSDGREVGHHLALRRPDVCRDRGSIRFRVWHGPAPGASVVSMSPPTAARPGHHQPCRILFCRRPSRDFAWRGGGMEVPPC